MVCGSVTSFPQLLAILSLVLLTFGKSSFSHARLALLEVSNVVATHKEFALVHGDSSFSSQKDNIVAGGVPSAAAEVKTYKTGGRRMSYSSTDDQKGQNTDAAASSALIHGAGEENEENWKQFLMAFAADYTPPRAHPPIHN